MDTTQLKTKLHFYICDSYFAELKSVIKEYANVEAFSFKAKCIYQGMPDPFVKTEAKGAKRYILGGCSLENNNHDHNTVLTQEESCLHLFAPKTLIDGYITRGAYLLTPGWLKEWEYVVQEVWGFDQNTAQSFFAEFCNKIVLIDTLVEPNSKELLEAFAQFIDRPYSVVPLGLEYFQNYVDNTIQAEIIQNYTNNKQQYTLALQEKSNYAMAFDLLSQLNEKLNEKEIIDKIVEIFTMLFAPQKIIYVAIDNAHIIKKFSCGAFKKSGVFKLLGDMEKYSLEEDGFWLKLIYDEHVIGLLSVKDVAFKQYLGSYLNLAISISELCALAIANARNDLKTKEVEAQLTQSSKLASMGEMLSSIAHQWRQPLNTLNLNIEMLEEYYESEQIDEAFIENFISKNSATIQFLSQTISHFSNFFRIDKEKEYFSIKYAILSIMGIIGVQLSNHNIQYSVSGEDYEYLGLGNEFKQVILNIINNAKDAIIASQQREGKISIKIAKKKDTISIVIKDNGGGVDEDIMERIFEPYFTTKEEGKGVGLGLYISKMIIEENMQGNLSVGNSNNGAVFTIKLMDSNEKE